MEVEYVVVENNYNQVIWMKKMLKDIRIEIIKPIVTHCENKRMVNMSKNLVFHSKTKNISIKYHMLREKVTKKVEYVIVEKNCNHIFWMKQMLKDIRIQFSEPLVIHCDNTSIVNMSKNLVLYSNTKHISIITC